MSETPSSCTLPRPHAEERGRPRRGWAGPSLSAGGRRRRPALRGSADAGDGAADRSYGSQRSHRPPVHPRQARAGDHAGGTRRPHRRRRAQSREGIVHRYPDRVLLKLVHVCAVYCRFCFRRETVGPGSSGMLSAEALDGAFAYIRATPALWEVVVTGGDPLVLSPRRLRELVERARRNPASQDPALAYAASRRCAGTRHRRAVRALTASGKTVYVAVHANHPRELTAEARAACDTAAPRGGRRWSARACC